MGKLLVAILSLSITIAMLSPFAFGTYVIAKKYNEKNADVTTELGANQRIEYDENGMPKLITDSEPLKEFTYDSVQGTTQPENEDNQVKPVNYSAEISGYCQFGFNTDTFEMYTPEGEEKSSIVKYLQTTDSSRKNAKIMISYATDLSTKTDIPGYITREACGLNIMTNDSFNVDIEGTNWLCIYEDNSIETRHDDNADYDSYIYYLMAADGNSAVYMRVNIYKDANKDYIDGSIKEILKSVRVYGTKTIFQTPTTGYYAENPDNRDGKAQNQEGYKENDPDNPVYQHVDNRSGKEISDDWTSLEMYIGDTKVKLPCSLQWFYDNGFVNTRSYQNMDEQLVPLETRAVYLSDDKHVNFNVVLINDSDTPRKLCECSVQGILVDTSVITNPADMPDDYITIPGGFMINANVDDVIKYFGEPTGYEMQKNSLGEDVRLYVWKRDKYEMRLALKPVSGITIIALSYG